jgi:4-amino-4-deoxy-L-arabinose transferase-like glycosyltransferase
MKNKKEGNEGNEEEKRGKEGNEWEKEGNEGDERDEERAGNEGNETQIIRSELPALLLLLSVFLVSLLAINSLNPMLYWDENVYLGNARSHISESNFTEDFRFPLIEYIIAGAWFFTGESVFIARLIVILFSVSSILLLYLIAREYFSRWLSFFLCVLFAFSPLMLLWGFRVGTDVPAMFFIILSFYFLLKWENKMIFAAVAGIFAAAAFLMRFSTGLFALPVLIYFIVNKKPKELMLFISFFVIAVSPWVVYNQAAYENPVWDLQEQYSVVAKWTSPEPVSRQVLNFFDFTNILIPILFVFGFYVMLEKRKLNYKLNLLILVYVIISFIVYLFFVNLKEARYYLMFLPFIYLISFSGLSWLESNKKKIFILVFAVLVVAFISESLFMVYFISAKTPCETDNSITKSVDYLKYKTTTGDVILTNIPPWIGYPLNVKAYSLQHENVTGLLEMYNFTYIVYNDREGSKYNREVLNNASVLELEKTFTGKCDENTYVYKAINK